MSEAAGNVQIILSVNQATYTQAMKEAQRQLDTFAGKAKGAGHSTVSSMQASSAAIRTFEGGMTNNIRAVERFISTIPGVGKALQAAFPVIGGIALAGLFVHLGSEAKKFIDKINLIPEALSKGFQALNLSQQSANDTLAVTNDKLEIEIAKLEKKPINNLALSLDESRVAADKLAQSLQTDMERVEALTKENHISFLGGLITGKASTSEVEKTIKKYADDLSKLGYQFSQATRQGNTDQAAQIKAQIDATRSYIHDWATQQLTMRTGRYTYMPDGSIKYGKEGAASYAAQNGNQDANLSEIQGYDTSVYLDQEGEQEEVKNKQLDQTKQTDETKKQLAQQAREAQQKADEATIQAWHQQLDDLKAAQDMTLGQEANYWIDRAASVKYGSKTYLTALEEANKDIAAGRAQNMRSQAEYDKTAAEPAEISDANKEYAPAISEQSKATAEYLKNWNENAQIQRQNAAALAESSLQMSVATGRINGINAAQTQARLHTDEYTDSITRLQKALADVSKETYLTDPERKQKASDLQNQIDTLNGKRSIQVLQDQQSIQSQTVSGAMTQALDEMVNRWTDMATQIKDAVTSSMEQFNSSLASALMAHTHSGREYRMGIKNAIGSSARGAGTRLLNSGMNEAEGGVLKAFGFGGKKPTGAPGDALHTIVDNLSGGFSSDPLSNILKSGGLDSGSGSQSRSGIGGIFSSLFHSVFQGGRAGGGDFVANRPMLVGELGPELMMPRSAGTIIPNHAMTSGDTHYWNIDASNSNDPAATEAAVHRAINRAMPMIVGHSVNGMRESQRRFPLSRR